MNDNAHFETVFSTFPLFYFAMVVAGLSYITFAVMMNLIKRSRGLTLSGTKTHVKQRFLPLTPLLMVSDVLWSPVLPA